MTYGRNGCDIWEEWVCRWDNGEMCASRPAVRFVFCIGWAVSCWREAVRVLGGGGGWGGGAKSAHVLCSFATSPNVSIPSVAICALSASHLARSSTSTCCDGIFFFRYGMCVGCREWGVGVILFSLFSMAVRKKLHVHGSNDGCANI